MNGFSRSFGRQKADEMKKILLLGGSPQQVIAINTAKRLGLFTVLCDYLPDNPGQYAADRFYLVSTTDKPAVLEVAKKEKIDAVLAYASDPAAPAAAYVAEQLGLPGNPWDSVEILCNKDRFRKFLRENGFDTPLEADFQDPREAVARIPNQGFRFPVILKPADSCGSKGATVLRSWEDLSQAVDFAFSFSRGHRIVAEEFIEKSHPYLIGGDIFVVNGKVILWGLMNCHRDEKANPLVPVGKSYPPALEPQVEQKVHKSLQALVDRLHIRTGAMNVELLVDRENRVFPIDIGPRNGGNMIPDLLSLIYGVDMVEMSILGALDQLEPRPIPEGTPFYATHNLHSRENGIYENITFSPELEPYILKKCFYKEPGDRVEFFDNAAKALGILFLKFDSQQEMHRILDGIEDRIHIHLRQSHG